MVNRQVTKKCQRRDSFTTAAAIVFVAELADKFVVAEANARQIGR